MNVRILVVGPEKHRLDELRACLPAGSEWDWAGLVHNIQDTVDSLLRLSPGLVLLDPELPGFGGGALVRRILEVHPRARVLILGSQIDPEILRDLFRAGARGVCLKEDLSEELPAALAAVAKGRFFIGTAAAEAMVEMAVQSSRIRPSGVLERLTDREREVLVLLVSGLSTKQAAARMGLAPKTVDTHRKNLMEKLEVDNLVDLVKLAIREGLTSL